MSLTVQEVSSASMQCSLLLGAGAQTDSPRCKQAVAGAQATEHACMHHMMRLDTLPASILLASPETCCLYRRLHCSK